VEVVDRILGARPQPQYRDNLADRIDGHPQPQHVRPVPQPRAQFVQLHMRQVQAFLKRSCSVALCSPARVSQEVMLAWRWPNTRAAAETSSPSASALSTSARCWDAVLRRYSGVTQRVGAPRSEAGAARLAAQGLSALATPVRAVTREAHGPVHPGSDRTAQVRLRQAKPWVAIRPMAPRRLFSLHQGVKGASVGAFPAAAAMRRRQAGHSEGVRGFSSRWAVAVIAVVWDRGCC
jgi:hypothetical protein